MRQKHPKPLSGIIRQYKTLANILRYYSDFTPDNPAPPQSASFFTPNPRRRSLSDLIFGRESRRETGAESENLELPY